MTRSKFDLIKEAFIEEMWGTEVLLSEKVVRGAFSDQVDLKAIIDDLLEAPLPSMILSMPEMETEIEAEADTIPETKLSLGMLIDTAKKAPTLGTYIRIKAHRSNRITYRAALFEQGQISRDYWSRLLNDEVRASKEKLLRVAVLLELNLEEAEEMLEHVGYSLSTTIPRDIVVAYCLREQHYDFVVIEQLLADHHIQSLFNDRRVGL
jgi:predicted HTH domain antitoxin